MTTEANNTNRMCWRSGKVRSKQFHGNLRIFWRKKKVHIGDLDRNFRVLAYNSKLVRFDQFT